MLPEGNDERVRRRAYEIWEREGRPHGREAEHWRMATEELAREQEGADESQVVPAKRVTPPPQDGQQPTEAAPERPPPAEDASERPIEATPDDTRPPGTADRPEPESDPLGLAQPQPDSAQAPQRPATKRKRAAPRPRKPRKGAPSNDPDRSS